MPGPISDLVAKLMTSRDGVLPAIQAFPALDLEQIAGELRLDDRARESGQQNQPPENSAVADLAELDIESEIERRARKAGDDYRSQLELYEGRVRRALASTDEAVGIEAAGESAITDFKVSAVDDLNHLHTVRMDVEGRQQEFDNFRRIHSLSRLPNIISTRERVMRWAFIAILVLVESTLNGMFFAKGSESGLIGGFVQALAFSVLNIGVAVLIGLYALPRLMHRSAVWKMVGTLGLVFYIAWLGFINLFIAHFRDLYISNGADTAVDDIWRALAVSPLALNDTQSWLLAAMGIMLSLFSLIDAMKLDDLYPGFGAIGQRREDAIYRYTDDKARCLAGLTNLRDNAIADMRKVIDLMRAADYDLRLAVDGRRRLHQNYCAFLSHLADAHARLTRRYHEANVVARTSPTPTRFLNKPTQLPILSEPPLDALPDLGHDARRHTIDRTEHFIRAVNRQFEEEVARYHTVTDLTRKVEGPLVSS